MPQFVLEFTQPDGSHERIDCEWGPPWEPPPDSRTLYEKKYAAEIVEGFNEYVRAFLQNGKAPATMWVALWANLLTSPGGIQSKVIGDELYGGPQTHLPSSIAFELADRAGLDWVDEVVGRVTFPQLLELAKRNKKKQEAETAVPAPKQKGRKPKTDPKEAEILRAHQPGQRHEATAEIANVKTPDGRWDALRVKRVLNAVGERKRRKRSTK